MCVEIVVELFEPAAIIENQNFLIRFEFRKNRILLRNRSVDDGQLFPGRNRDIRVREQRIRHRSGSLPGIGIGIAGKGRGIRCIIHHRQIPVDQLVDLGVDIRDFGGIVRAVPGLLLRLTGRIFRRRIFEGVPVALRFPFPLVDIRIRIVGCRCCCIDNLRHGGRFKQNTVFQAKHFDILDPHDSPRQSMTFPIRRS